MTEPETPPDGAAEKPPNAPWYGAVVFGLLVCSAAWLFLYAFADLAWQQGLGAWNYLITLLISVVPSQMLEHWRGDGRKYDGRPYRRRRKRAERQAQKAAEAGGGEPA